MTANKSILAAIGAWSVMALVLLSTATPAQAALSFVNGSFDTPGTTAGAYYSATTYTPAGLGGWTLTGLAGANQITCIVPASAAGPVPGPNAQICTGNAPATSTATHGFFFSLYQYPGASPNGGNYFLADGDSNFVSALQQTVTGLVAAHTYRVSFYQAAGQENCLYDDGVGCPPPGGQITGRWDVTFGGATKSSTTMTTTVTPTGGGLTPWNAQSLTFTIASGTQSVISFLAVGTPNGAPPLVFLDGITITDVTTPEPGTSLLFGFGLMLLPLGGWLRKRRRAS